MVPGVKNYKKMKYLKMVKDGDTAIILSKEERELVTNAIYSQMIQSDATKESELAKPKEDQNEGLINRCTSNAKGLELLFEAFKSINY